jgi:hypothetical protein
MKICRSCNIEKPLIDFYVHSRMKDGHLNKCKSCVKKRIKTYVQNNPDKVKVWSKNYFSSEKGQKQRIEYLATESGKVARKKGMDVYRKKYPLKYAAHTLTSYWLKIGKLTKPTICSVCNSNQELHAHHDDYREPANVRWLCVPCHKEWHRHNKPIYE